MASETAPTSYIYKTNQKPYQKLSTISNSFLEIGGEIFSNRIQSSRAVHLITADVSVLKVFSVVLYRYYEMAETERRMIYFILFCYACDLKAYYENPFFVKALSDNNMLIVDYASFIPIGMRGNTKKANKKKYSFLAVSVFIGFLHQILCKNIVLNLISHTTEFQILRSELMHSERRLCFLLLSYLGNRNLHELWLEVLHETIRHEYIERGVDMSGTNYYLLNKEINRRLRDFKVNLDPNQRIENRQLKKENDVYLRELMGDMEGKIMDLMGQGFDAKPTLNIDDVFSQTVSYFTKLDDGMQESALGEVILTMQFPELVKSSNYQQHQHHQPQRNVPATTSFQDTLKREKEKKLIKTTTTRPHDDDDDDDDDQLPQPIVKTKTKATKKKSRSDFFKELEQTLPDVPAVVDKKVSEEELSARKEEESRKRKVNLKKQEKKKRDAEFLEKKKNFNKKTITTTTTTMTTRVEDESRKESCGGANKNDKNDKMETTSEGGTENVAEEIEMISVTNSREDLNELDEKEDRKRRKDSKSSPSQSNQLQGGDDNDDDRLEKEIKHRKKKRKEAAAEEERENRRKRRRDSKVLPTQSNQTQGAAGHDTIDGDDNVEKKKKKIN